MVNGRNSKLSIWKICTAGIFLTVALNSKVIAGVESLNLDQVKQGLDTVWVLLGAFLVFFMQAGFGMVEAGFIRAKNTCNILTKNFLDFCMASLGVFVLWFGWFGFNAGSTLGVTDGSIIARVAINTNLAAAMGGIAAMATVWKRFGKPDLSMAMNGALAGLVAITAPCAFVEPWAALVIGIVAGYVVVRGVELLDKLNIDDPVGAVPVHGMCGILGTLCLGIFGKQSLGLANDGFVYSGNPMQLGIQMVGSVSTIAFVVITMSVVFKLIDVTIGLRVSREEELRGLDIGEHGMEAYAGFQIFSTV